MKKLLFNVLAVLCSLYASAQNGDVNLDSLMEGDAVPSIEYAKNAFKSTRVINGHSMEMLGKGVLDTRILHRFGTINNGAKDLFGLDAASMRMGFDYGVSKNLTIGIGRSTFKKELDGFVKYRILAQHTGKTNMPISLLYVGGITCHTLPLLGPPALTEFSNRLGYYHSLIIGRKFSTNFTAQISPTFVHTNLVDLANQSNDQIAIGIGARYKITRRFALMLDTYPIISGRNTNLTPLSLGVDIETGGHVFQLHFSNATGMNERAFITETTGSWAQAQVRFGFNLSRVFTIRANTEGSW
ncbi:MAG: hypothetical protein RL660_1901 [Bacteroidota bacterium]|jgi:hypothetical protein